MGTDSKSGPNTSAFERIGRGKIVWTLVPLSLILGGSALYLGSVRTSIGGNSLWRTFWEQSAEVLTFVLGVIALVFAGKQYLDARQHSKGLKTVTESLQQTATNLEKRVDAVQEKFGQLHDAAEKLNQAVGLVMGRISVIEDALLTVPQGAFVGDLGRHMTVIYTSLLAALVPRSLKPGMTAGRSSAEALAEVIRRLLGALAGLASSWDSRQSRYAANVMIFIPCQETSPLFPKLDVNEVRRFLPKYYDLSFLEGILVLALDLSAVATSDCEPDVNRDMSLEKVIFGIPRDRNFEELLPGAPRAFAKWQKTGEAMPLRAAVEGHDDILQMAKKEPLDPTVRTAIEDYYCLTEPGKKIRSFQSYPLMHLDGTAEAFGVLNIHCDHPIFLGEADGPVAQKRQQTFAAFVSPIVFEIAGLVKMWLDQEKINYL